MTDMNGTAIIVAFIVAVIGPIVSGFFAIRANNRNAREAKAIATVAAEKTAQVATTLSYATETTNSKLNEIGEDTKTIHVLVNSRLTKLLEELADVREKLARMQPENAEAQQLAQEARADVMNKPAPPGES